MKIYANIQLKCKNKTWQKSIKFLIIVLKNISVKILNHLLLSESILISYLLIKNNVLHNISESSLTYLYEVLREGLTNNYIYKLYIKILSKYQNTQ